MWYKRAVEYHYNNPSSFVFSVPFDIGDTRPTLVTATHAIFKEENGQKAPAAVVGVHIDYDKFEKNFMKVTTGAEGHGYKVRTTFQLTYISFRCRPKAENSSPVRMNQLNATCSTTTVLS